MMPANGMTQRVVLCGEKKNITIKERPMEDLISIMLPFGGFEVILMAIELEVNVYDFQC